MTMPQPTDSTDEPAIFAVTIDTDTTTAAILNELLIAHELVGSVWDDAETRHAVLTIYTDTEAEAPGDTAPHRRACNTSTSSA